MNFFQRWLKPPACKHVYKLLDKPVYYLRSDGIPSVMVKCIYCGEVFDNATDGR